MITRLGLVALLMFSVSTFAQQQGVPGSDSTAVTTVNIVVLPNILITDVTDIYVDIQDRSQDVTIEQDFCVVGNTSGNFVLQANGADSPGTPFVLTNDRGDALPFDLTFNGNIEAAIDTPLSPGIDSPPYELENRGLDCGGAPNAKIIIRFDAEDLIFAPAGLFSGDLSLTVAIE